MKFVSINYNEKYSKVSEHNSFIGSKYENFVFVIVLYLHVSMGCCGT